MKTDITRRGVLGTLTAASVAACQPAKRTAFTAPGAMAEGAFRHGIASGDPQSRAVIIWTRLTPDDPSLGPVEGVWELDRDPEFGSLAASGAFTTNAARDWTVKIDVQNLDPGTDYFYRFRTGSLISPVGTTRTLPEGNVESVRLAVVSCANWQHGFFNVYDHISRQDHFDLLLHLGDYFYEYAATDYLDSAASGINRTHLPAHEIIELDDYRQRHAQYRTDPSLQAATAKLPLVAIWDDHESSNDSWHGGAENHGPDEGEWVTRKQAAMRAYYEWMPVRDPKPGQTREALFRDLEFGDLLSLVTVETRLTARAEPLILENHVDAITAEGGAEKFKAEILGDPGREMFGRAQEDFIIDRLEASKAGGKPWRVLANQVIMGRLETTDLTPYVDEAAVEYIAQDWAGVRDFITLSKYNLPVYPDSWDGYPAARNRFYKRLIDKDVRDIIVLTGDAHEFWANKLTTEDGEKIGLEFVTSSVSSKTMTAYLGDGTADYSLLLTQTNDDARYYNALHNGYIDIEFGRKNGTVRMMGVSTVLSRDYEAFEVAQFKIKPDGVSKKVTSPKGLNFKQRVLFAGIG